MFKGWTAEAVVSRRLAAAQQDKPKKVAKIPAEGANKITKNVLDTINSHPGCKAYRVNNTGIYDAAKKIRRKGNTKKGLPDVWCCIRGKFVVIEVKAGRDKLSPDQIERRDEIIKAGGVFVEARTTTAFLTWWSDFIK